MGRCCEKAGLKKGLWTPEEDQKLMAYIDRHGYGRWHALPAKAGLRRCGKSCRLRWINYLKPDIKRGKFSLQEEATMIKLHALLGNRWSVIAAFLPKRTDNDIKNYWNTHVKKTLTKMGIDHITHKPKSGTTLCSGLRHMAQWETTRLEAEARLVRQSKLRLAMTSSSSTKPQHHEPYLTTHSHNHGGHVLGYNGEVMVEGIMGNSPFGYVGSFEDNNVGWDDKIMSLVEASGFPMDDEFGVNCSSFSVVK